jgi:hypothetical protein
MARLLSGNIGLPRDIKWHGETLQTGVWKEPVPGGSIARRLDTGTGRINAGEKIVFIGDRYRNWRRAIRTNSTARDLLPIWNSNG